MKTFILGAVSVLALASAASAADAPKFDLYRSTDAAQSVVAIAALGDAAPFSVAAGADKGALDILAAAAATTAIADLKAKTDESAMPNIAAAEAVVEKETKKSKMAKQGEETSEARQIVMVKQIADEGREIKVERKIIKLDQPATDKTAATETQDAAETTPAFPTEETAMAGDEDLAKFAKADGGKIFVIEQSENGAPVRLVKISGVGADSARSFIDETKGLDDAEKTAMKTKLGL